MLHQMKGKRWSIPLISKEEEGFKLHEEALEFLSTVPGGKKIHVLSIVGKVKTGKSYLLNKLVQIFKRQSQEEQYFPMSNNLNDCTKGISILTQWIQTNDSVILVLDMEGLGSLTNTTSYDSKLFAIGMLLSSTIIYNNVGPIDEQALQNFSVLIEIGKLFDKSMPDSLKGLGLPSLFMVLRDFSLTFENKEGRIVTSRQYLQNCLQEQKGVSESMAAKNRIRRVIKSLFTCRNCQSLILPSQDLPITFQSEVRVQFLQELDGLSGKLLAQIQENPKRIKSQQLSSSQYVLYVREFMDSFNSNGNSIPRIDNILVQMYRKQANSLAAVFIKQISQIRRVYQEKIDTLNISSSSYRLSSQYLGDHRDDSKIRLTQKIIADCYKWIGQIRNRYLQICQQMEALIKNQGNYDISVSLQYENVNIVKIKQFKQIFEARREMDDEISTKIQQLQEFMSKERSRLIKKQECEEQIQKLNLLVDCLSVVESEKQLESKYMEFIGSFKESGKQLSSSVVENYLLKLEVTYLRRKIELKDRRDSSEDSLIRIEDQQEEKIVLQNVQINTLKPQKYIKTSNQKQNHFQTKMIETLASFASRQICFNQSHASRQLLQHPPNLSKQSQKPICSFQNAKSFYVPYVIISDVQTMNVQIVRTLIKQDSKRTNYVQYVLEVVLVHKRWMFSRKWKDFCELNNILHNLFSKDSLPPFEPSIINPTRYIEDALLFKQEQIETRRRKLEKYLRKLLEQEEIRNSRIMQKFLKINKEYITTL